ncbi:CIMIP2 protein CG18335-like isoform X1 [Diachasmimorpha longicaudata]|uniref:CIMIP2 protein CG18335-like isoform X1 n=1 Tax=Diachasmimorpha longicaudata TaxID=58733 RepID=UPI0030B8FF22
MLLASQPVEGDNKTANMATVSLLTTPQPHLVPGYAGFCPQYRYRCGETYGNVTHKLLLDPTIDRSETLVLSNRVADDYEVMRPPKDDLDIVTARTKRMDATYKYPMLPGYQGFMPNLNARLGQRYTISAVEGLADFERQQLKDKAALNQLRNVIAVQDGMAHPRSLAERTMMKTEFKMPLMTVRPDWARMMRNTPVEEDCRPPHSPNPSPYFMETTDDEKYFVKGNHNCFFPSIVFLDPPLCGIFNGCKFSRSSLHLFLLFVEMNQSPMHTGIGRYTGHVPHGYEYFGGSHKPVTNSALCEFTTNYRTRQSAEWAPASISRPDPPLLIQPAELYHKHVGMLPNYLGHIPGAAFRYGKTFGADTRDAKRWLRGDFSH